MGKQATTLDEQIDILRRRGMVIVDENKAKEVLLDIGYYRLGFYWFAFEKSYPELANRTHEFKNGTCFSDAVHLYYFDFNLRNILHKYLSRIEISVRTYLTYSVSNKYKDKPTWFVDSAIVSRAQALAFGNNVYDVSIRHLPEIKRHHNTYINDKYAPAWKTIEHMTMGAVINLYKSLRDENVKIEISKHFGINFPIVFVNYMNIIRNLRNASAHGNVLFDFTPERSIRKGPAMRKDIGKNQNLNGAIHILLYMLKRISVNRHDDCAKEIGNLLCEYKQNKNIAEILYNVSGLRESF